MRSSAALYNGNIKGPKDSIKSGSEDAGWNGVKAGLDGSNTTASLKARLRCEESGRSPFGPNRTLMGDSGGRSSGKAEAADSRI